MITWKVFESITYVHTVEANSEEEAITKVNESDDSGKLVDGSEFIVEKVS